MTDDYLTTILEEAKLIAEQHDQVARTTDNQAHEDLRYAVLRILGGQTDPLPTGWTPIDGVTVGVQLQFGSPLVDGHRFVECLEDFESSVVPIRQLLDAVLNWPDHPYRPSISTQASFANVAK
jgi:hypothetical protein